MILYFLDSHLVTLLQQALTINGNQKVHNVL